MANRWLPNGRLADGTLLMGPLIEKPSDINPVLEVVVDGAPHYVAYCCQELSPEQQQQIRNWVVERLAERAQRS